MSIATLRTNSLAELVEDFLADCRAAGLSPKTINMAYGYPLREVFLPWCQSMSIERPEQLNGQVLNRFSTHLQTAGGKRGPLARASINSYLSPLRRLLKWANERGELPAVKVRLLRLPREMLEVLAEDELAAMERQAGSERNALIVRMLGGAGLRAGELVGIRDRDLVARNKGYYVRVRGKAQGGGKERLVPVHVEVFRRLEKLARTRPVDYEGDRVFIQATRRPGRPRQALTVSGVEQLVRTVAVNAGIKRRVWPHLLRHSFATNRLRAGMDPIVLAQILGHEGLQMIQRVYAHLNAEDSYEALIRSLASER